ncbi:MAG: DUF4180 domain-containing protein [Bacteroidales bacterium]
MEINIVRINGTAIAEVVSDTIIIFETEDALDIMANASYMGSGSIILHEANINPEFFDLKSGLAGDILQKFSTYGVKLAIIGDFSSIGSKSLKDFIRESNRLGHVNFTATYEEAIKALAR